MVSAGDAAFGLRGLARIADNERIDTGSAPVTISGKHSAVSATALPGSHSSVPCAPMWTSASTLRHVLQPKPEGDERVPRRQQRIMIVGAALAARPRSGGKRDR